MANHIAAIARRHPDLEPLAELTPGNLHRRLIRENRNLPSTTLVNGQLALRPCFIGAGIVSDL